MRSTKSVAELIGITEAEAEKLIAMADVPEEISRKYVKSVTSEEAIPTPDGLLAFAARISPTRKVSKQANSATGKLRAQSLALLREHEKAGTLPTSNRFLFYELVQRGVVAKSRQGDQQLCKVLIQLRKDGTVPWDWIIDETRSVDHTLVAPSVREWLLKVVDQARIDPWQGDPPFVLTESRSLAGVLRRHAQTYAVPLAATNGQVGGFLHTDVAPMLHCDQNVIYLGDLDLTGGQIEANTRKVLESEVGTLRWERLALTSQQVKKYHLPKNIKEDHRYSPPRQAESWETEALSQQVLERMFIKRLDQLLPQPLSKVQERERRQRAQMRKVLR